MIAKFETLVDVRERERESYILEDSVSKANVVCDIQKIIGRVV